MHESTTMRTNSHQKHTGERDYMVTATRDSNEASVKERRKGGWPQLGMSEDSMCDIYWPCVL